MAHLSPYRVSLLAGGMRPAGHARPPARARASRIAVTTFGRYEILERLAVGGMAEVYRARAWVADGVSEDVVIKKILPGYSADPEFRSLFVQEARISVGLTHSRITQVLDFGLMDGSYFIAMELVDGPNLGALLAAIRRDFVRMPIGAAVHVIAEVLEGRDYAHRRTGASARTASRSRSCTGTSRRRTCSCRVPAT